MIADVSYRSFKVWQRNRDVLMHLWRSELSWPLVEPTIVLLGIGLGLGQFVELNDGQDYIQFIVPGIMAAFPMWATIFEGSFSAYARMEMQQTYAAMIATPVSIDDVIAGEVLWAATKGTISAAYVLLIALVLSPFYDLVQSPLIVLALPVAFLGNLMFASMALLAMSKVRSTSELGYFITIAVIPMFWTAGVFFPLDEMPQWVQVASWFLPLRHVVDLERAFFSGDIGAGALVDVGWIFLATGVLFVAALASVRRRLIR